MKFSLEIACDNAAFEDDPSLEIARILRRLADELCDVVLTPSVFPLRDVNGNRVGTAKVEC